MAPPDRLSHVDSVPSRTVTPFGRERESSLAVYAVDGECLLVSDRTRMVLDRAAVLDLAHALQVAGLVLLFPAGAPDVAADVHARQMGDGLGLAWPT